MTPSIEHILLQYYSDGRSNKYTDLKGRKKWFDKGHHNIMHEVLPDHVLRQMDYSNPFFKALMDDAKCKEDILLFKYDTLIRYSRMSGVDARTKEMALQQLANKKSCDPTSRTNYLNIWNQQHKKFDQCVSEHLSEYCASSNKRNARWKTWSRRRR